VVTVHFGTLWRFRRTSLRFAVQVSAHFAADGDASHRRAARTWSPKDREDGIRRSPDLTIELSRAELHERSTSLL
jgi:hypothetical protein